MSGLKLTIISFVSVFAIVIAVLWGMYDVENQAISLEEQVKSAYSDINIQEKRRVDLIYNLVDTVQNYDKHEASTLQAIVEARANGKGDINDVTTLISSVAESYPELKSNENYKELMNELSVTENLIAQHRTNYNQQIKEYNRYVKKSPRRQILGIVGYKTLSTEEHDYLDYDAPTTAPQNLYGE